MRFSLPSRLTLYLLGVALLSFCLCVAYTLWINVEVRLYRAAIERKRAWSERLTAIGPKNVVYGGSSCAFSIDGERMESAFNCPTVNFGLHAGYGADFLTRLALTACREGDNLVVALEPGVLTERIEQTSLAVQTSYALGERALIAPHSGSGLQLFNRLEELYSLRPGGLHAFGMLGKALRRQPMYRYSIEDVHPSGWFTTSARRPMGPTPDNGNELSPDGKALLNTILRESQARGAWAMYSLPWALAGTEEVSPYRLKRLRFLRQIMAFIPVLHDPALGIQSDPSLFSDTEWHLSESGAALRSDQLAQSLTHQKFWSEADLASIERSLLQVP